MRLGVGTRGLSPTLAGVLVCSSLILLGPVYAVPGYSWIAHTSSDLGAQNTPNSWLMNLGFVALGLGVGADAFRLWWRAPFISLVFMLFALSMMMTGVFSLRPIDPVLPYDELEDWLHSLFATMVGTSFVAGAMSFAFWGQEPPRSRLTCLAAAFLATVLSVAIHVWPAYDGLFQRAMFLVTFTWFAVFLPGGRIGRNHTRGVRPES